MSSGKPELQGVEGQLLPHLSPLRMAVTVSFWQGYVCPYREELGTSALVLDTPKIEETLSPYFCVQEVTLI